MEKNKEKVLKRNLEQKAFEDAAEAIKAGKEDGNLTNVELVENMVKGYKGKTVKAPIDVIIASTIFLNARELMGVIKALEIDLYTKMLNELKEKTDKGEATAKDVMAALMLAATMMK